MVSGKRADAESPSEILRTAFRMHGREIGFQRGQAIIRKGERASCVYLVTEGYVDVVTDSEPGMVLLSLTQGDIIGELAALTHKPRSASVVGRTDGKVYCVDTTKFEQLLSDPEVVRALLTILAHKLILTTQRVEVLEMRRAPARVARALLFFHRQPYVTHPRVTQRFLEHFCRVAERQMRRILDEFRARGFIEWFGKPREIRARDPEGLEQVVNSALRAKPERGQR
ncbi:MAG: Crp/Fnr family transcriptional regulator [bacterium JZ-2024 1]